MMNNKPRGICFNKNALNIQSIPITQATNAGDNIDNLKASALATENNTQQQLKTTNQLQQQLQPIKKLFLNFNNKLNEAAVNTISDENALIEPLNKVTSLATKLITGGGESKQANKQDTIVQDKLNELKVNPLVSKQQSTKETIGDDNDDFALIDLSSTEKVKKPEQDGRESPNEPSPPKLRSYKRNSLHIQSLNQHLLNQHEALNDENLSEVDNKTELTKKQNKKQTEDKVLTNLDLKPPQESALSRIPRLSLRLPQAPLVLNQRNGSSILQKQLTKRTISGPLFAKKETENVFHEEEEEEEEEEIEDIDKSTNRDAIYLVCDVAKDIYEYMYDLEKAQAIKEDYLKDQKVLTPKVRQRLINWCIEIHSQLNLLTETLYTTVSIMDRFFDKVPIKIQSQVQLVAVGCTLIAAKYEEIYPPDINDLVHLTQNMYSRREIMRVEIYILEQLNFDLGKPIPLAFLRRYSKAAHSDLKMHSIAKYLMELSLTEYQCSHWRPSMLAAAALFATIHMVQPCENGSTLLSSANARKAVQKPMRDRWSKSLVHYTHYTRKELQGPAGTLCKILKKAQKNPQLYYCAKKNLSSLSKWPELKSTRVDELIKLGDQ